MIVSSISVKNNILANITYEELITTIQCNEKIFNKETVKKVYCEILKVNMEDAMHCLENDMDFILSNLDS